MKSKGCGSSSPARAAESWRVCARLAARHNDCLISDLSVLQLGVCQAGAQAHAAHAMRALLLAL